MPNYTKNLIAGVLALGLILGTVVYLVRLDREQERYMASKGYVWQPTRNSGYVKAGN